jgi:hypothetical protein
MATVSDALAAMMHPLVISPLIINPPIHHAKVRLCRPPTVVAVYRACESSSGASQGTRKAGEARSVARSVG